MPDLDTIEKLTTPEGVLDWIENDFDTLDKGCLCGSCWSLDWDTIKYLAESVRLRNDRAG